MIPYPVPKVPSVSISMETQTHTFKSVFLFCFMNTFHYQWKHTHSIPYQMIPYHTIPYHTIPYHTIPYRTISCHVDMWTRYNAMASKPYHTINTMQYPTMVPYHTILYNTILWCHVDCGRDTKLSQVQPPPFNNSNPKRLLKLFQRNTHSPCQAKEKLSKNEQIYFMHNFERNTAHL